MMLACRKFQWVALLSFLVLLAVVWLSQMQALDKFLYCESALPDDSPSKASSFSQEAVEVAPMNTNNNDGWHTIQVFYGQKSLVEQKFKTPHQQWFSQSNQDQIVASLFSNKTNGYFVDLAANDAAYLSNTLALERQFGWKGLCIEANPKYWRSLSFRDCQVVAAAVGKNRMEQVDFVLDGVFGGIRGDEFDNNNKTKKTERQKKAEISTYFTVPLLEILERNQAPRIIDYFSLDVEGAESYIMNDFPFEKYIIQVLTVERPKNDLKERLQANGYKLLRIISAFGETLWAHESVLESLDMSMILRNFRKKRNKNTTTEPKNVPEQKQ